MLSQVFLSYGGRVASQDITLQNLREQTTLKFDRENEKLSLGVQLSKYMGWYWTSEKTH